MQADRSRPLSTTTSYWHGGVGDYSIRSVNWRLSCIAKFTRSMEYFIVMLCAVFAAEIRSKLTGLVSGVTRLQWARVQVFQKGPLFPKKN